MAQVSYNGRVPFLSRNQQRQRTEGTQSTDLNHVKQSGGLILSCSGKQLPKDGALNSHYAGCLTSVPTTKAP